MIKFIYGTMNAGKTTQLVKMYELLSKKGEKVLVIKPSIDDREGTFNGWGTTKSKKYDKEIPVFYYKNILKALQKDKTVLLIDEAQFMQKQDVLYTVVYAESMGLNVYAYGLKTDVNGNLFEGSAAWLAMADEVKEIKHICEICGCNEKANYHNRYINGLRDTNKKSIEIDKGNISYKAVCYKHWMEK